MDILRAYGVTIFITAAGNGAGTLDHLHGGLCDLEAGLQIPEQKYHSIFTLPRCSANTFCLYLRGAVPGIEGQPDGLILPYLVNVFYAGAEELMSSVPMSIIRPARKWTRPGQFPDLREIRSSAVKGGHSPQLRLFVAPAGLLE